MLQQAGVGGPLRVLVLGGPGQPALGRGPLATGGEGVGTRVGWRGQDQKLLPWSRQCMTSFWKILG